MDGLEKKIAERRLRICIDAKHQQIGAIEGVAFYRILLRHQDEITLLERQVMGHVDMMVRERMHYCIQAKRAQVVLDLESTEEEQVLADRNQIEVLFSVLLSNALDAISPGGRITIQSCRLSAGELELRIADNGCGISGTDFPHVFEPFFTTKESGKGTGLGLAIAQNIVKEHGGTIVIENKPDQGAVARMRFPVICGAPSGTGD